MTVAFSTKPFMTNTWSFLLVPPAVLILTSCLWAAVHPGPLRHHVRWILQSDQLLQGGAPASGLLPFLPRCSGSRPAPAAG